MKIIRTMVFFILLCSFLLVSCAEEKETFPQFDITSIDTSDTLETSTINQENEEVSFTLALPYSITTQTRLIKLYYLSTTGELSSSGATIDLDYLDQVEIPWETDYIITPFEGVTDSVLLEWEEGGDVPDLFLVNNLLNAYETGLLLELDDYTYDDERMTLGSINHLSILESTIDNHLFSIPHYESFYIFYMNLDYYSMDSIDIYPSILEFEELALNSELPEEILPFIIDEDSEDVLSRKSASFLGSTSSLSLWNSYYPSRLSYILPPSDSEGYIPYKSLYSLCLYEDTNEASFLSDFASFVSFDPNAIELIYRLENMDGFFPLSDNGSTWDMIRENSSLGTSIINYFYNSFEQGIYVDSSDELEISFSFMEE